MANTPTQPDAALHAIATARIDLDRAHDANPGLPVDVVTAMAQAYACLEACQIAVRASYAPRERSWLRRK
jgi:ABC-type amino acid transport substrate-binding protein